MYLCFYYLSVHGSAGEGDGNDLLIIYFNDNIK